MDMDTGTILTCSHVVKDAHLNTGFNNPCVNACVMEYLTLSVISVYPGYIRDKVSKVLAVQVHRDGVKGDGRKKIKVLYRQHPLTHQFDLALVQLEGLPPSVSSSRTPVCVTTPVEGTRVYVVGHALFGAEHCLPPSVTSGVISKVICINRIPVMIQTTCAVHPGASGGALVDTRGRLLGIVVCNARDNSCGASFPHVNMSIPVCTVWATIQRFLNTRDVGHLDQLCVKNSLLDTIWSLDSAQDMKVSPLVSKL